VSKKYNKMSRENPTCKLGFVPAHEELKNTKKPPLKLYQKRG